MHYLCCSYANECFILLNLLQVPELCVYLQNITKWGQKTISPGKNFPNLYLVVVTDLWWEYFVLISLAWSFLQWLRFHTRTDRCCVCWGTILRCAPKHFSLWHQDLKVTRIVFFVVALVKIKLLVDPSSIWTLWTCKTHLKSHSLGTKYQTVASANIYSFSQNLLHFSPIVPLNFTGEPQV